MFSPATKGYAMGKIVKWIQQLNWNILILLCVIPGLTPFTPPHLFEKIAMLVNGTLVRPLDWFDLFFHGLPWALAAVKLGISFKDPT